MRNLLSAFLGTALVSTTSTTAFSQLIELNIEGSYVSSPGLSIAIPILPLDKIIIAKDAILVSPLMSGFEKGMAIQRRTGATGSYSANYKRDNGDSVPYQFNGTLREINADASKIVLNVRTESVGLAPNRLVNLRDITNTTYTFTRRGNSCTATVSDEQPKQIICESIPGTRHKCANTSPTQVVRTFKIDKCTVDRAW